MVAHGWNGKCVVTLDIYRHRDLVNDFGVDGFWCAACACFVSVCVWGLFSLVR